MDDLTILRLFEARDEAAIPRAEQTYGGYCANVVRAILPSAQDVEEVLSDTWLQAWRTIPPQKPQHLHLYLARIARNLAFDRYRAQNRAKRGSGEVALALDELAHCLPAPGTVEDVLSARELARCINAFVGELPARERSIFLRRYFFVESIAAIAQGCGLTQTNVRTILTRTRKKLKIRLEKERYEP